MRVASRVREFVRESGVVFVALDEFLLLRIQAVLGGSQFALQELDLLFELPLILITLLLGGNAEMIQRFTRVAMFF